MAARSPKASAPAYAGLAVMAVLGAFLAYFIGVRPYHDLRIALAFVETSCKVTGKGFEAGATRRFAQPALDVVYEAGGRVVRSRGFDDRGGSKLSQFTSRGTAHRMLDAFETGATYRCWYDPREPARVVLVRNKSFLLPLAFAWIVAVLAAMAAVGLRSRAGRVLGAIGLDVFAVLLGYELVEDWLRGWPNYFLLALLAVLAAVVASFTAWVAWESLFPPSSRSGGEKA